MAKKKIIMLASAILIVILIWGLIFLSSDKKEKQDETSDFIADSKCVTTIVSETTLGVEAGTVQNVFDDNSSSDGNMPSETNKNETEDYELSNSDKEIDPNKENQTATVDSAQEESTDSFYTQNETDSSDVTYEMYCNMNAEEQKKFFESFESADDFFEWYNKAKEEYDSLNNEIQIDDEQVTLDQ